MGINCVATNYESYDIFDVVSDDIFFMGVSKQNGTNLPLWKIKKYWTINGVTKMGFPNGCQDRKFSWDDRTDYTYK